METVRTQVVPATRDHIYAMRGKFRESDEQECFSVNGVSAYVGTLGAYLQSKISWTALLYGEPVLVFGVTQPSFFGTSGVPWFAATNDLRKVGLEVIRKSKKYVKEMRDSVGVLEAWVHEDNIVSQKWLKWCGLKETEAEEYGVKKDSYKRFYL